MRLGLIDEKVIFEYGEKEKVIEIVVLDDNNKEDIEQFGVRLLEAEGFVCFFSNFFDFVNNFFFEPNFLPQNNFFPKKFD